MMSLAEKMGQSKPNIERRIPEVNDLVIQQDQFAAIDKSVLWAEIAVNQAEFMAHGFLGQRPKKTGGCRSLLGGIKVIRLQAKAVEICCVCKRFANLWSGLRGLAVNGTQNEPKLFKVLGNDPAREQDRLPILVLLRYRVHRHQVIRGILEGKRWGCARRSQSIKP